MNSAPISDTHTMGATVAGVYALRRAPMRMYSRPLRMWRLASWRRYEWLQMGNNHEPRYAHLRGELVRRGSYVLELVPYDVSPSVSRIAVILK